MLKCPLASLRLPTVSSVAYKGSWRREAFRTYSFSLLVVASLWGVATPQVRRCQVRVKPWRLKLCGYRSVKVKVKVDFQVEYLSHSFEVIWEPIKSLWLRVGDKIRNIFVFLYIFWRFFLFGWYILYACIHRNWKYKSDQ